MRSRHLLLALSAEFTVAALASAMIVASYSILRHFRPGTGTYLPLIGGVVVASVLGAVVANRHADSKIIGLVAASAVGLMTTVLSIGGLVSLFGS